MKRFLALILSICLAGPAGAAVVYLRDGSRLRGTVVGATARDLQLYTPQGVLRIDAGDIARIDYGETETPAAAAPAPPPGGTWAHEEAPLNQSLSFGFGIAVPLSRVDPGSTGGSSGDNGDGGGHFDVRYLHFGTPRLGLGFDLGYMNRSPSSDFSFLPLANTRISGNSFLALATVKYMFSLRRAAQPYAVLGAGASHTSMQIESQPLLGYTWSDTNTDEPRRLVDDARWGPAAAAGLGVDLPIAEDSAVGLEMAWTGVFNHRYGATAAGRDVGLDSVTGALHALSVGIRWGWKF